MEKDCLTILGVDYRHCRLEDGADIYFTKYGIPFAGSLMPDSFWLDKEWFRQNSVRLSGTSSVYRVRTKDVDGRGKDIVVKWNRMGQDVPGGEWSEGLYDAEFNSPFEEFSLVMEVRQSRRDERVLTQKPLAIYVPANKRELMRTGRKEYKMVAKIESHKEIKIDMLRPYAVIYEWVKGLDSAQASREEMITTEEMVAVVVEGERRMKNHGFVVRDNKPHHYIVRPCGGSDVIRKPGGVIANALIDFELLERTTEREEETRKVKRSDYLKRQRDRFAARQGPSLPSHLEQMEVLGVDYLCGEVASTGGYLWVVGRDPGLYDYFLPERWEQTPRKRLSSLRDIYYTETKDHIHLVWKASRVGFVPDVDPFKEEEKRLLEQGYNSPFEEVALAMYLSAHGIQTTYPRAIYRTGTMVENWEDRKDKSRFDSHGEVCVSGEKLLLDEKYGYITVWGYWNGPDEKLAMTDGDYYEAIDALGAYRKGVITEETYLRLVQATIERLSSVGVEDLHLGGSHILLSLDSRGTIVRDRSGLPETRICSFEFLRRTHNFPQSN